MDLEMNEPQQKYKLQLLGKKGRVSFMGGGGGGVFVCWRLLILFFS